MITCEQQLKQRQEERQLSLCNLQRTARILFWPAARSPPCSVYVCVVKCIVCCPLRVRAVLWHTTQFLLPLKHGREKEYRCKSALEHIH